MPLGDIADVFYAEEMEGDGYNLAEANGWKQYDSVSTVGDPKREKRKMEEKDILDLLRC